MNLENQDIYSISFGIFLFFLTIFVVARQISNRNKIPLKIDGNSEVVLEQSQIDFEDETADQQEIVGFYLFSIDGSPFSFEQLSNYFQNLSLTYNNEFFFMTKFEKEIFRVANAKKPGTLDLTSNTNALMIVTDLLDQIDPVQTYDDMVDFASQFSEVHHANICDFERKPVSKQLINHFRNKATEIAQAQTLEKIQ